MMNTCLVSARRFIPLITSAKFTGCRKHNVFVNLFSVARFSNHWKTKSVFPRLGPSLISNNCLQHHPIRTTASNRFIPMSEKELREGIQIYDGAITKRVRFVKFFSASTSICSLAIIPAMFLSEDTTGLGILGVVAGSVASVMFFTPFFLHYFTKGYVTRMFLNHETDVYTVYTISFLLYDVKHEFQQKDVQVPSVANLFTSFKANGKAFMVDTESFNSPSDYAHLMGYDKMSIDIKDTEIEHANDKEK